MSMLLLVKQLRQKTGARLNDCVEAVKACDGDLEKAISWIQSRNMDRGAPEGKKAGEGQFGLNISHKDGSPVIILIELSSATDFAAKNDDFKRMLHLVSSHAILNNCKSLEELEQTIFIDSCTVADSVKTLAGKMGEPVRVRQFFRIDGPAGYYLHNDGKQAAIVGVSGVEPQEAWEIGKDLSMHVVFAKPQYLSVDDIPLATVTKELGRVHDQLKNDERMKGKPDNILGQIAKGQMNKFNSKVCLLEQPYYRENKKKVSQVLAEKNPSAKVKAFHRFMVGQ